MACDHSFGRGRALPALLLSLALAAPAAAGDWVHWRGPQRDGTSSETGLISGWDQDGEHLLWRADFTGRSTPVVFAGRVCANGRVGEDAERQEMVACFDAESGERLWERRWPVYHTTVPWNRVGWANPVIDPETGILFVQGVGGDFFAFDSADGEILWAKQLIEEFGFMEGYGGRTQTPLVHGDVVVVTFASSGWGAEAVPLHRLRAFDKRTGELLWVSTPGGRMADKNTQSTPAVGVVGGRELLVHGNADGHIYAVDAHTGEKIWGFALSKRGINTSVVLDGETVYAAHSEENLDEATMGRVVAIDAAGRGDVTASHERWRSPVSVGFSSPALHAGRLYVLDNSANLHALEAASGGHLWEVNVGRVGKASPVWADGRIYVTEVNGRFVVVDAGAEEARILDVEEIDMPGGERYAEVYGSVAVAYGRLYFTTEEGIYCLGDPQRPFVVEPSPRYDPGELPPPPAGAAPALLQVRPAEVRVGPGESVAFRGLAFDGRGRPLGEVVGGTWRVSGLAGSVDAGGRFRPDPSAGSQTGSVELTLGELTAAGRVRVLADLPLEEDFEDVEIGSRPSYMVGYVGRFEVAEMDGDRVLVKGPSPIKIHRHITFLGSPDWSATTIRADVMGSREGRRASDVGVITNGYTLELLGAHQELQIRSWPSELRIARSVDFAWDAGRWYAMKLEVRPGADEGEAAGATVRGKVWPRDEPEPAAWTIEVEDPVGIRHGSPGLTAFSPSPAYWDDIRVTANDD